MDDNVVHVDIIQDRLGIISEPISDGITFVWGKVVRGNFVWRQISIFDAYRPAAKGRDCALFDKSMGISTHVDYDI